ncbi:MAG: hypothetical protein ACOVMQ_07170 [Cyclobacteriaceae bacterium]|jgi:hypothetical protein
MKSLVLLFFLSLSGFAQAQGLIGTWQLTDDQTCLKSQFEKSDTEKELEKSMGSTQTGVAKLIRFDKKGNGEEGIFTVGKKKGTGMNSFQYDVKGNELFFKDKKSGLITQRFIIDEVTESTLKIHNALKDCEVKIFSRVK